VGAIDRFRFAAGKNRFAFKDLKNRLKDASFAPGSGFASACRLW